MTSRDRTLLSGQVAVITGAGSGIGAATAKMFLEHDVANLVLVDRDLAALQRTSEELGETQDRVVLREVDVSESEEVDQFYADLELGFNAMHILVNSAAVAQVGSIEDTSNERWHSTLGVNLTGSFQMARSAFTWMKQAGYGRVINISSLAGEVGGLLAGVDYVVSKSGVFGLTKSLARQGAAHGVTANTVAPGIIATPMSAPHSYTEDVVPMGRFGSPVEVAAAITFLASPAASYITGATLDVNGGVAMN